MLSQESSHAIFEMGNVEIIDLKTSLIQCPSCLHYVPKGTILCQCGKHTRPDLEMMRRIRAAFVILNAPCFRTSDGLVCRKNTTTKQKTHHGVLQKAKENLRRSGTDGKMMRPAGSLSLPMIGRMLG